MKKDIVAALNQTLQKRKKTSATNPVIMEVNRLLEYDALRDKEVLRMIGQQSTLVQSEQEVGSLIEIERKEKFYSGSIFTADQIVSLAAKYRLKFLSSKRFTSYIDPLVTSDVRELEKSISKSMIAEQAAKRNVTIDEYVANNDIVDFKFDAHQLKNNFYILAPAKCFKLEKEKAFTVFAPDPILFYTDDSQHFRLVRKWGKDFTIFRRLRGLMLHNRNSLFLSISIIVCFIASVLAISVRPECLWVLMGIIGVAIFMYVVDFDETFFGKKYVQSTSGY